MLANDRRFQHWLGMHKHAAVSQSQVDDRVFQFDSIMEDIFNGQFNMLLPPAFKKIKGTLSKENQEDTAIGGCGKSRPEQDRHEKRKIDQELASSIVRNNAQCQEFIKKTGETWDKHFRSQCPKKHPDWNKDVKLCARWYIKGDCYDTCPRAISHVPCSKVPPMQKEDFLTLMRECRECIATNKTD